jgi:hypothetical protein
VALCTAINTPGLQVPAAQPHTEFMTTNVVPFCAKVSSTSFADTSSSKPPSVSSAFIGKTISAGYICLLSYFVFSKTQKYIKS